MRLKEMSLASGEPERMQSIHLGEEIHANTRRTRITYRGDIDGQSVALKCYLKPLRGLFHWVRAHRKGGAIRRSGAPVPAVIYSGWLPEKSCFCFATRYLEGFVPLRDLMSTAPEQQPESLERLKQLLELLADLHARGVEQTDANLTNFLMNDEGEIAVVDEDGIRLTPGACTPLKATFNLASLVSRIPWLDDDITKFVWTWYSHYSVHGAALDRIEFDRQLSFWTRRLNSKKLEKERRRINGSV